MTALQQKKRRRIVFISPRFQGGTALAFVVLAVAGAALVALLLARDARQVLWDAAYSGHYRIGSAYEIAGTCVARYVAALLAGTLAAGIALFFLVAWRVRRGAERIAAVFRISGEGDLSTPTDAPGPGEFPVLGEQIDTARSGTLQAIGEIRAEVAAVRGAALSEEEFLRRWSGIKERIGRIAP